MKSISSWLASLGMSVAAWVASSIFTLAAASGVKLLLKVCERLRVPSDCKELAEVVAREHGNIHRCSGFSPAALVRLLERCDAFRKPQRFADILLACECDARGRLGLQDTPYPQARRLALALQTALGLGRLDEIGKRLLVSDGVDRVGGRLDDVDETVLGVGVGPTGQHRIVVLATGEADAVL